MADALEKLAVIRVRFDRSYGTMIDLVLERSLPVAFCSIYEPRFPDRALRRTTATALAVLNDVITRQVFTKRASLIDLRLVCDQDADFTNSIEPRIASSRMLLKDSAPMTGAASPNQVGGTNGERDQHGRTARAVGGGRAADCRARP